MNLKKLNALINLLEGLPEENFNMNTWWYSQQMAENAIEKPNCETVGCIAGWAAALQIAEANLGPLEGPIEGTFFSRAAQYLEIPYDTLEWDRFSLLCHSFELTQGAAIQKLKDWRNKFGRGKDEIHNVQRPD